MSRRNLGADKAAANQQVIKNLLKLPTNKMCADCKRNKLPRWASWNLGVFICIRCSGIHRGMGTHISRVKSVDLDTWTDEQLQSMVKWGNGRANKYWEANLAPGHVPSESKIENFIRTKYESKRWVMEGGIPDPSTLDDSDDDVPLKVVQQKLEARQSASPPPPPKAPPKPINLFDDDDSAPPAPSKPATTASQPRSASAQQQTKPADSLLGLDFFAAAPEPTPRAASATPEVAKPANDSRADMSSLRSSILSLYSSPPPRPTQSPSPALGYNHQPVQQPVQQQRSAFGDLNDAFGGLSLAPTATTAPAYGGAASPPPFQPAQEAPKPSPFASLASGGFFSTTPATAAKPAAAKPSSGFGDLFSLAPATTSPPPATTSSNNVFNLTPSQPAKPVTTTNTSSGFSAFDSDPWASAAPTKPAPAPAAVPAPAVSSNDIWGGQSSSMNAWASPAPAAAPKPAPVVKDDDDWGNFSSSTTAAAPAPAGNNGFDEDLFGNVWK
ncbi:ArfGap-domain-containing protein [Ascodesmis nigricans]|uniref:ArfGap-domain-containing protein n=1 Tax=Ascodesmis nigricans TaxID=341454 RepID=A0A4V6RHD5_9PEZI|nr:ArfGap-domain-containing protein [Ascodesmis nigricans]